MPENRFDDEQLEDRLRRAFRWMAEDAEAPGTDQASRGASPTGAPGQDAGLYLDDAPSEPARPGAMRKPVLVAAAVLVLVAVGVSVGVVASGTGGRSQGTGGTSSGAESIAHAQVVSALAATTSADNWDLSYTYGENEPGYAVPSTPTTVICSSPTTCSLTPPPTATQPRDVTVTGTGIINVNPKAMVADANVSNFGHVVLRISGTNVWEDLSGDSGGLAPDPGETAAGGNTLSGYAGLVESTLGTREGAVAMLGIASPTGYLELDEQAISGVKPNGTGTVNGESVTEYTVTVQPAQLASDPTATSEQVTAIQGALDTLQSAGMSGTTDQLAVDAQGFIVQSISTYRFSDGGSVTVDANFSNFGCAGTVLLPGQTGPTTPPAGCVGPDTQSPSTTAPTSVATTTTAPTANLIVPGHATTVPTTQAPSGRTGSSTSTSSGSNSSTTSSTTTTTSFVLVPNVTGESPAQAASALAQVGLATQFTGTQSGMRVTSQAPTAGSRVPSGSTVVLTTS